MKNRHFLILWLATAFAPLALTATPSPSKPVRSAVLSTEVHP